MLRYTRVWCRRRQPGPFLPPSEARLRSFLLGTYGYSLGTHGYNPGAYGCSLGSIRLPPLLLAQLDEEGVLADDLAEVDELGQQELGEHHREQLPRVLVLHAHEAAAVPVLPLGIVPCIAGSALVGSAMVGSAIVGSAVVNSAMVGSAVVGSAVVGSAIVGSAVVKSAVVGSAIVGSAVVGVVQVLDERRRGEVQVGAGSCLALRLVGGRLELHRLQEGDGDDRYTAVT